MFSNKSLQIKNSTKLELKELSDLLNHLYIELRNKEEFEKDPTVEFVSDQDNAINPLGKTAYYDPQKFHIVLYVDNRHPKDILRSFSHECIHHGQNLKGQFKKSFNTNPGYAQEDGHLRKMEEEAFLKGNMNFRDWEDKQKTSKQKLYESIYQKIASYKRKQEMSNKFDLSFINKRMKWYNKGQRDTTRLICEQLGYVRKDGSTFLDENCECKSDQELEESVRVHLDNDEPTEQKTLEEETDSQHNQNDKLPGPVNHVKLKPDIQNQMKQEFNSKKGQPLEGTNYKVGDSVSFEGAQWVVFDYEDPEKELTLVDPNFSTMTYMFINQPEVQQQLQQSTPEEEAADKQWQQEKALQESVRKLAKRVISSIREKLKD